MIAAAFQARSGPCLEGRYPQGREALLSGEVSGTPGHAQLDRASHDVNSRFREGGWTNRQLDRPTGSLDI